MFGLYLVINALLWSHPSQILKPMKLIAVFFHEFSHATMCWLTGGRVEGIEVYNNEGGVTKYRGGRRLCVIPAGCMCRLDDVVCVSLVLNHCTHKCPRIHLSTDIGGAVFGGIFVAFSGDRIAATIACSFFIACLLTALFYSPNKTMAYLNLGFALATLAFILFDWFVATPFIQFVCLYYGVTIGSFSIYDTIEDTVTRKFTIVRGRSGMNVIRNLQ